MINDEDVVAVRAATNIVGVISQFVPLKRVGRRWVGLCPFHPEKTPSFSVNEEAGLFYCFGCQKKGDAITFLRELEGLDFVAAVERLAAKANVSLRYTDADAGESRRRRHRLSEAVERAVQWYHERLLTGADAGPARGYLRSRGISGDEVRQFRLGWAPPGWDELARTLRLSDADWRDSGLGLINRKGRQQDFFRGRILFPIFDPQGDPIGFGGRKLEGADGPKYLNPGATAIYDKSKVLYGLSAAKADIVSVQEAIVCEGYTDVIGFFQAGMGRAVATCGTALTEDHVKLLTRFAKRLVLAFDADGAGQAAAERFHRWEQTHDLDVAVANLPVGVDPADLARRDPDALRRAVEQAVPFLAFRVQRIFAAADLHSAEGRARAATRALGVIAAHPDALVRDQYLLEVSSRCRIDAGQLREQLRRPEATTAAAGGPAGRANQRERPAPGDRTARGGPNDRAAIDLRPVPVRRVAGSAAEHDALRGAVDDPDEALAWLDPVLFTEGPHRRAFEALIAWPTLPAALDAIEGDDPDAADALRQAAAEQSDATIGDIFLRLSQEAARRVLVDLKQEALHASDPLALSAELAHVASLHSTLMSDEAAPEAKLQAGTDLLAWLLEPGEGMR
jgi:DNA primase